MISGSYRTSDNAVNCSELLAINLIMTSHSDFTSTISQQYDTLEKSISIHKLPISVATIALSVTVESKFHVATIVTSHNTCVEYD